RSVTSARRDTIQRSASEGSPDEVAIGSGREVSTNRAAFQSLLVKLRPPVTLASVSRWSTPGALPETSAKRSASAPISPISSSGSPTFRACCWPFGGLAQGGVPVRAIPGRDAVSPPQLAAHRPVVDVLHPVGVDLLEPLGHDPGAPFAHGSQRPLGERLDVNEPLGGEAGLDHGVAALAVADHHLVRLL